MGARGRAVVLAAATVLVRLAPGAAAQVGAGAVTGVVRDQSGAPLPGAAVTAIGLATNRSIAVVSSGAGVYTVPPLAPGVYRLAVSLSGFRPLVRTACAWAPARPVGSTLASRSAA